MIQDLSGLWCIKGTGESTLVMDSPVPLMNYDPDRSWITDPDLASYADALWARHVIFLPHERLLKRMGYLIRPITAHFSIKAANFEPG